jgi:hypothetical protein
MGDPLDAAGSMRDHGPLLADAEVDPAASVGLARGAGAVSDDRGDRDEQPATVLAERHRQHSRLPLGEQPLKPPGVLLAAQPANHRQGEVGAIGLQPQRAGGEPDPAAIPTAGLEPGEPDPGAGSVAVFGSRAVRRAVTRSAIPEA